MITEIFIVEFILIMTAIYSNSVLGDQIDQFPSEAEEDNVFVKLDAQKLTDRDMDIIVQHAIQKRQCTFLDLQKNEITSAGMPPLVLALDNNTKLHALYLHENRLLDKGIYQLAQTLTSNNQTLEVLGLNSIGLTDVGAEDLAVMLQKNHVLKRLQLQANEIGDRGILYLAEALTTHNTTLEHLELAENKFIADANLNFLLDMIKSNRSLKVLDLRLCGISDSGKAQLQEAAKANENLQLIL